ncbi:hypothetical protein PCH_Pc24g01610 [Penicillium rubens Wisconsin 54-1255]|uniref:Uncharacterized protein n=1 Tax=Penicillium rubens (strain ATCC 28089 / DSM 1075 / NRRL 1951 / Wisconsin 54-1255) TaxID=500485 RepID=B6HWV1_PENRW|nr:hypothetical protein PCH_Pc24g01610 [Penicillium rubens Wisconsin 54-1255]
MSQWAFISGSSCTALAMPWNDRSGRASSGRSNNTASTSSPIMVKCRLEVQLVSSDKMLVAEGSSVLSSDSFPPQGSTSSLPAGAYAATNRASIELEYQPALWDISIDIFIFRSMICSDRRTLRSGAKKGSARFATRYDREPLV